MNDQIKDDVQFLARVLHHGVLYGLHDVTGAQRERLRALATERPELSPIPEGAEEHYDLRADFCAQWRNLVEADPEFLTKKANRMRRAIRFLGPTCGDAWAAFTDLISAFPLLAERATVSKREMVEPPIPEGAEEFVSDGMRALRFVDLENHPCEVRAPRRGRLEARWPLIMGHGEFSGAALDDAIIPEFVSQWLRSVWTTMQGPDIFAPATQAEIDAHEPPTPEQFREAAERGEREAREWEERHLSHNQRNVVSTKSGDYELRWHRGRPQWRPFVESHEWNDWGELVPQPGYEDAVAWFEGCRAAHLASVTAGYVDTMKNDVIPALEAKRRGEPQEPSTDGDALDGYTLLTRASADYPGDSVADVACRQWQAERARHAEEVERRERLIRSLEETRAKEWSYNAARIAELEDQRKQLLSAGSIHPRKSDKSLTTYANVAVRVEMEALRTEKDQRIAELEAIVERMESTQLVTRSGGGMATQHGSMLQRGWGDTVDRATKAEAALAEERGKREQAESRAVDANDIAKARKLVPDYPWSESPTAGEVMWALFGAVEGVEMANREVHAEWERSKSRADKLAAELETLHERGQVFAGRFGFAWPPLDTPEAVGPVWRDAPETIEETGLYRVEWDADGCPPVWWFESGDRIDDMSQFPEGLPAYPQRIAGPITITEPREEEADA